MKRMPTAIHCVLALGLVLGPAASVGAVDLTITPAAIPNDFRGSVTLTITGLTNGETVVIERFADFNTNGLIDSWELMVQSFRVRDGQMNRIGGVANLNRPFDLDAVTNAAISTQLRFLRPDLGLTVGDYLFRVSSPSGRFEPVLTPFVISNGDHEQRITGSVSCAGTNVPYALVVLLDPATDGEFVAAVVSDASGDFTLPAPPGDYMLFPARGK